MQERALEILDSEDTFAAIEFLNQQIDPSQVLEAYIKLANHLYNEKHDLHRFMMLSMAGIQYGLSAARSAESEQAYQCSSSAKGMAYNLAANTWPGWDDPGITIDLSHKRIGMDAAKLNLRLAVSLKKGDLPTSRAYWMLGAHHMAAEKADYNAARTAFETAARYARSAEKEDEALLSEGYGALVDVLSSPENPTFRAALDGIKTKLAAHENSAFLIGQLDTAERVFLAPI